MKENIAFVKHKQDAIKTQRDNNNNKKKTTKGLFREQKELLET